MATKRKAAKATKGSATMKPGEVLAEGVVVTHDERGVMVGREADPGETCPAGHSEHRFGNRLVFLSHNQAPIPPAGLHKRKGR